MESAVFLAFLVVGAISAVFELDIALRLCWIVEFGVVVGIEEKVSKSSRYCGKSVGR